MSFTANAFNKAKQVTHKPHLGCLLFRFELTMVILSLDLNMSPSCLFHACPVFRRHAGPLLLPHSRSCILPLARFLLQKRKRNKEIIVRSSIWPSQLQCRRFFFRANIETFSRSPIKIILMICLFHFAA